MRTFPSVSKLTPVCLVLAAMFAATHASSQVYGFDGSQVQLQRPNLSVVGSGCPVSMKASQRSVAQQVEAGSIVPVRPAQGLTLTMAGFRALKITSAEVVVHALSPRTRPLFVSSLDDANVSRPFSLVAKKSGGFNEDLWMDGVTSIRWVEVKSITYSNGTVWHESETQRCSVTPDPFVLISSTR